MGVSDRDLDLLIVGAGPTGLSLAVAAARHGLSCRVVDRSAGPSEHSKALGVMPRTLEIFDQIGIADAALERGFPLSRARVRVDGDPVAEVRIQGVESPFPRPLVLAQSETERLLIGALESLGGEVEWEVELTGLEEEPGGIVGAIRGEAGAETVRARWVAGCDGAHSDVRDATGLPFEGAEYPEEFVLADVRVGDPVEEGLAHVFFHGPDFLVALPMKGRRRFRLIATRPPGTESGEEPDLAEFEHLFEAVAGVDAGISDPEWLARFRLHRRIVPEFRRGRVFLLGDSAHIHSPIGAQGMNAGIQDAWNLGWKMGLVSTGTAGDGLLDSYDPERRPVGESIVRWTDVAFRAAMGQSAPARWARRVVPAIGLRSERLQGFLSRVISQVGQGYRDSPIVAEGDGADFDGGPRPGDRAPDGNLAEGGGGGERSTVHSLLREPRHLLLWFLEVGGEGPPDVDAAVESLAALARSGPIGRSRVRGIGTGDGGTFGAPGSMAPLVDVAGEAFRAYGVRGSGVYLVRPDGHVAYRGPLDPTPLARFLDRYR